MSLNPTSCCPLHHGTSYNASAITPVVSALRFFVVLTAVRTYPRSTYHADKGPYIINSCFLTDASLPHHLYVRQTLPANAVGHRRQRNVPKRRVSLSPRSRWGNPVFRRQQQGIVYFANTMDD